MAIQDHHQLQTQHYDYYFLNFIPTPLSLSTLIGFLINKDQKLGGLV
jgi:hypothetical protein